MSVSIPVFHYYPLMSHNPYFIIFLQFVFVLLFLNAFGLVAEEPHKEITTSATITEHITDFPFTCDNLTNIGIDAAANYWSVTYAFVCCNETDACITSLYATTGSGSWYQEIDIFYGTIVI